MNEINYSYENSSKRAYYGIDGEGRLFRKPTDAEIQKGGADIITHEKQKGEKKGEKVLRKVVQAIHGKVSAFWIKSSDYGDNLIIELYENGFTSILQIPIDSSFTDDLLRKVNNIKEGETYTLQSWKMQAKDDKGADIKDKFVRGVSVKDANGNKIERYINKEVQEKLVPLTSCPLYKADESKQSKDFWQFYFKLVLNAFKERVVPKNQERFKRWADKNIEHEPSTESNVAYAVVVPNAPKAEKVVEPEFLVPDNYEDLPF